MEHFGVFATSEKALLLKRDYIACSRIKRIPPAIEIVMIVQHPFAVLTSFNPVTQHKYHIAPDRWLGEMAAVHHLLDTDRLGPL